MHGYYLHYRDIENPNRVQTGIDKKVAAQIAALNRAGLECEFRLCVQPETVVRTVASCLPLFPDGIRWPAPETLADADYLYIRRPRFASRELLHFLWGFRKVRPDALVMYEVPSYPYDREMGSLKLIPARSKDRRWRRKLSTCVDFVVDLTHAKDIFRIPTVQISNGVELEGIIPRAPSYRAGQPIDIVFVAYFEPWHGADRLIRGVADYLRTDSAREVRLHLAGGGSQLPKLQSLAARLGVGDVVEFLGPLDSSELDVLYDRCTLAVECLGAHRKGDSNFVSSSLKTREYLAKGMPFIHSCDVDFLLREEADFCLRVPGDESPIDFSEVVAFHDELYGHEDEAKLIKRIRAYAERHVSIDAAMEDVIDLIRERCAQD